MIHNMFTDLGINLLVILAGGFTAGVVCKRTGTPMIIGYLIVGAIIGQMFTSGGHPSHHAPSEVPPPSVIHHDTEVSTNVMEMTVLEGFAHLGAVLLLFSIGLQFTPSELSRTWHYFLVGGPVQMLGVMVPITIVTVIFGGDWKVGLMIGAAAALSSTVLVYKSLEDLGQVSAPNGQCAVAILLFQDIAIVPLLLLMSLLATLAQTTAASGDMLDQMPFAVASMIYNSLLFCGFVWLVRFAFCRWVSEFLFSLKNLELLVLFTAVLFLTLMMVAILLKLPSAIGALAAGVILSETRLSQQILALTIPLREMFSAIFFVSLGGLLRFQILEDAPVTTFALFFSMIALKTVASGIAFRALGLNWRVAIAMGLGVSQLGELSFVLLNDSVSRGLLSQQLYQQMLFVALSSIILTPLFLKIALRVPTETANQAMAAQHSSHPAAVHVASAQNHVSSQHSSASIAEQPPTVSGTGHRTRRAILVGAGPIGKNVASYLELEGFDICLIDMNPVNLHPFAQLGFRTIAGDASSPDKLRLAGITHCQLVVVTVPSDYIALDVISAVTELNPRADMVVRCRYSENVATYNASGAKWVVCEETEACAGFKRALENII